MDVGPPGQEAAVHGRRDRPAHEWDGFQWIDANDTVQSIAAFVRYAKGARPRPPAAPAPPPEEPAKQGDPSSVEAIATTERSPTMPPPNDETTTADGLTRVGPHVVFVGSFTPVPRHGYRIGVPSPGRYREILNTDATEYGGSGMGNLGLVETQPIPAHGFEQSVVLTLPPLGGLYLVPETP
jgi:1,4-alpha-glucan branching enzyme